MPLPVVVEVVRIAPRMYDYDNLVAAFKGIRDTIASLLVPGLRPGQADSNSGITWIYSQKKGAPKEYALEIIITPNV